MAQLVKKDFKVLMRSKLNAFLVIFGPLIFIFIVGSIFGEYSSSNLRIKVGVYSDDMENLQVKSLTDKISDNGMKILRYDSAEQCSRAVETSATNVCMVFPPNFAPGSQNELKMYFDFSQIQVPLLLMRVMKGKIDAKEEEITFELTNRLLGMMQLTSEKVRGQSQMLVQMSSEGEKARLEVSSIYGDLSAFDISFDDGGFNITLMEQKVNNTNNRLDLLSNETQKNIASNKASIMIFRTQIDGVDSDLTVLGSEIEVYKKNVTAQKQACSALLTQIGTYSGKPVNCTSIPPPPKNLTSSQYDVLVTTNISAILPFYICQCVNTATELESSLNNVSVTVNQKKIQLADAKAKLLKAEADLDASSALFANFTNQSKADASAALVELQKLDQSLASAKNTVDQANVMRQDMLMQIGGLQNSLDSSLSSIEAMKAGVESVSAGLDEFAVLKTESIVYPIKTSYIRLHADKKVLHRLFPSLMMLIIMLVGIISSSSIVIGEKNSPAYLRNFITPVKDYIFLLGTYITNMIIIFAQILLVFVIGKFFFNIPVLNHIHLVVIAIMIISTFFILLGMVIGFSFSSDEVATVVSVLLALLMFVLSPFLIPLEGLGEKVARLLSYNPYNLGENMIGNIIIKEAGLWGSKVAIFIMIGFSVYLWFLLRNVQRLSKEKAGK